MLALRSPIVTVALLLTACATGVTQDLPDEEGSAGSTGSGGSVTDGGTPSTAGKPAGSSGSVSAAGMTANPFGGTGNTAGKSSGGASGSGGANAGGVSSAGSGGKATAGSSGTSTGGKGGSGGAAGASGSGGSGGSVVVGTGSCEGTAAFELGAGNKYAANAKVVAVCMGGTPCTLANPAGTAGMTYEFSCTDQYNCGGQDPGKTNWAQPPWQLTKACTP
jgi:hypothetical protein